MKRGFVIHHNGPPASCVGRTHTRCIAFWDAVRNYHVNTKGWSDIAYSFGVCPHGIRFTGRGWFKNQFANGADVVGEYDGKDSEWFTVLVFLGTDEEPTPEMIEGVRNLIIDGRSLGRCGQRVLPHNAFKVKACPGPEFTALARQWDNNASLAPAKEWDEMATKDEIRAVVIDALNDRNTWVADRIGNAHNYAKYVRLAIDPIAEAVKAPIDIDEDQIAAAIAASIPADIAQAVIDHLKERL